MAISPAPPEPPARQARLLARLALARPDEQPPTALAAAVHALADLIGVALAGAATPAARAFADLVTPDRRPGSALIWASATRASPQEAVLANAFAAHALDFDDDETEIAMAHLSVTAMTAAVTLAETSPGAVPGRALLGAYVNGCNVALALGARLNPGLYRAGWHATSALGVFAAAAAAGSLLALTEDEMAQALGLAASLSSGVRGAFGGDGKPLQVAQSAASGVWAAMLARTGHKASETALFGARGFLAMHGAALDPPADWPRAIAGFPPPGFVTKQFPSCTATHAAVAALLDLVATASAGAREIAAIECRIDPFVPQILRDGRPRTPDEARFNLAYCLASAAVDGELGPAAFQDEALDRARILEVMDKVRTVAAPDLPKGVSGIATGAVVTVTFADGRTATRQRDAAPGSAASPLSDGVLLGKFVQCVAPIHDERAARAAFADLMSLCDAADVRGPLARILSPET